MELRNLHSFLRVAELGNFTRAAEDLGYNQSTVTIQIHQLEDEIGAPVFERIGKKILLTPQGQELIGYANQILCLEQQIKQIGNADQQDIQGSIRIGIVESIMNSLFLSIVKEYRRRYPHVFIQVIPAVSTTLFDLLRHNDVDLIFTLGTMANVKDCVRAASHEEYAVFAAAPEHPLAQRAEVAVAEILDYPLILNGEHTFLQQELYKLAMRSGKEVISSIQSESSSIIVNLARQNLGIALQAEYLIRTASEKQELNILPVRDFSLPFYIHVFYHKNKWGTPQMLGLIQLVEEYWAEMDPTE